MKGPLTSFCLKLDDLSISWKASMSRRLPRKSLNSLLLLDKTLRILRRGFVLGSDGSSPPFSIAC